MFHSSDAEQSALESDEEGVPFEGDYVPFEGDYDPYSFPRSGSAVYPGDAYVYPGADGLVIEVVQQEQGPSEVPRRHVPPDGVLQGLGLLQGGRGRFRGLFGRHIL